MLANYQRNWTLHTFTSVALHTWAEILLMQCLCPSIQLVSSTTKHDLFYTLLQADTGMLSNQRIVPEPELKLRWKMLPKLKLKLNRKLKSHWWWLIEMSHLWVISVAVVVQVRLVQVREVLQVNWPTWNRLWDKIQQTPLQLLPTTILWYIAFIIMQWLHVKWNYFDNISVFCFTCLTLK